MTYSMARAEMMEELKADHAKQNAQINLLLAENERHRIGRDLHDSLGHTLLCSVSRQTWLINS